MLKTDERIFRIILEYIYTGKLVSAPKDLPKVAKLADEYGILSILDNIKHCQKIDDENVIDLLRVSEDYLGGTFTEMCTDYIAKKYQEFKEKQEFLDIIFEGNRNFLFVLMEKLINKKF